MVSVVFIYLGSDLSKTRPPKATTSPFTSMSHHGGGVIQFVMEIENLDFPNAVRFLAKRANMEVPEDNTPKATTSPFTSMTGNISRFRNLS